MIHGLVQARKKTDRQSHAGGRAAGAHRRAVDQVQACRAIIWKKDLEANWEVCPKCDHHFRLGARRRLELLLDDERWIEHRRRARLERSAAFHGHQALRPAPERRAAQTGHERRHPHRRRPLDGRPVICCSMEFGFIGGSMGAVVGEKVARAIERSLAQKHAADHRFLLRRRAHDGGRRQPDAAGKSFRRARRASTKRACRYISVLTDPTTGGVTASYAMLGDLNIAEPGALIGFAGPRVIEQTIRQKLPEGFQTAEFLLEHGFLDAVVPRKELKPYIARRSIFSSRDDRYA